MAEITNIQKAFKALKIDGRLYAQREGNELMFYSINSDGAMCISNLHKMDSGDVLTEPYPVANKKREYGIETFTVEQITSNWIIIPRSEINAIDFAEFKKQRGG